MRVFEFFSKVYGIFEMLIDIIVNIVQSTISLFSALTLGSSFTALIMSFFPPLIAASFSAVVAFAVVKLIVGR
jgi:hypothetical protein